MDGLTLLGAQEAIAAWKKGCREQTLALEVAGHHCAACSRALIEGLRRILTLRKREAPTLWLDACAHAGAAGTAGCARCTGRIVREVEALRAPSLSVRFEFPHERLGWKP